MAYCSIDCTNEIAGLRFKNWSATYDIKCDAFKIKSTDQSVTVIALCSLLSSSDEVSYSKKVDGSYTKIEPLTKPFLLTFKFNKKTYQTYQDKNWIDTEPSAYEQFATKYLERVCSEDKQYKGFFAVYPVREDQTELLLNFDESDPLYAKAELLREMRIELSELPEPNEALSAANFTEEKSFSGGKKYKTPTESLQDKVDAINGLIKKQLACSTELVGIPTDKHLEFLLTDECTLTNEDLISEAISIRDILLRLF